MRSHDEFKEELLRRKAEFDQHRHRRNSLITRSICAVLCLCLILTFTLPSTRVNAENLLEGYAPNRVSGRAPDDAFLSAQMDFALNLLRNSYTGENTLVSPLSATLALSLIANGAGGQTLAQIEDTLCGGIPIARWNEHLKYYVNLLPTTDQVTLHQANAIWYAQDSNLSLRPAYLQTITDYYNAELYAAPFNDATKSEINKWISDRTDGLIEDALDELDGVMYLINALAFDGKWANPYDPQDISEHPFHSADGSTGMVDMMFSEEGTFLQSATATGFSKHYDGGNYRFVAILPNADITLDEYLTSLTAKDLTTLLNSARSRTVEAGLPGFEYECSMELTDALRNMGITDVFEASSANLSFMADTRTNFLYVDSVLQKTRISVDAEGTKAAAVTIGGVNTTSAPFPRETVILDRPFLYLIVDARTNLPVFIGTITNLG